MGEVAELEPTSGEIGDKVLETFSLSLNGVTVELSSLGASIARFLVPSADEGTDDIVLGFQSPKDMLLTQNPAYFGAIVGRVANRIAKGSFELQETGEMYVLETNNMPNHLHGGSNGFSQRIWDAAIVDIGTGETQEAPGVSEYPEAPPCKAVMFSLLSEDGDQGYPGAVLVTATYSLQSSNDDDDDRCGVKLCLEMKASLQGTMPTPINLAQHSYFNLSRHDDPNGILDHKLTLNSDAYTPLDNVSIPTREVRSLNDDSVMDWRQGRTFREALAEYGVAKAGLTRQQAEEATSVSRSVTDVAKSAANSDTPDAPYGFDHNYVVRRNNADDSGLNVVGTMEHLSSGRRLTVRTDAPGVQLYTANYLDGGVSVPRPEVCKNAAIYGQWQGVCLETQHYPDSLSHGEDDDNKFPEFSAGKCIILRPGEPDYKHRVEYDLQYPYSSIATTTSADAAFFRGSDSEGRQYDSIEEMWECQGVLASDGDAADVSTWYDRAAQYYEENCPANLDGVLGGFANITDLDLEGSKRFIRELEALNPSFQWSSGAAAECGAGIGRVTKGLLISLGVPQCDLIESSARLIAAAPEYLGDSVGRCNCRYFCLGLQEWYPSAGTFSMIWVQWVFCYLTDEDAVAFLKRCSESLVEGGVIVLKENTCDKDDDFIVDMDDASVTRSVPYLIQLAEKAGLRLRLQTLQDDFPDEIYPVPMLALEVDPTK
jgi:galactose mutarotase-like enzyme